MSEPNPAPRRSDARAAPRTNMFIAAMVCWEQHRNPVKIRNMSITGALVESPVIPPLGSSVLLLRGSFSAAGRVVWIDRNRCGLHLSAAVNVRDWMAPPANTEQQRVDQIVALVKAGAIPIPAGPLAERLELPASLTNDRLTEDLGLISQLIDDLGDDLASDPETLMHHGTKLQNLDIAMQMLTAICNALSARIAATAPGWRGLRISGPAAVRPWARLHAHYKV